MIKANELRLLNYLQFNKQVFQVKEIKILKNRFSVNGRPPSYYEGIPISEEWLLNLGFERVFTNYYWYQIRIGDKRLLVSILGNIEIDKFDRTMIGFISICEYVHQLQNLYFALTGEELVFSTEP